MGWLGSFARSWLATYAIESKINAEVQSQQHYLISLLMTSGALAKC